MAASPDSPQRAAHERRTALLLVVAACVVASLGIWLADGMLHTRAGGDSPFLLIRTAELASAIADGALPARWMSDSAFGLGYPFFVYYAALPFYLAAFPAVFGASVITSVQIVQTLGIVAAAAAMFGLARRWLPPLGAALAAVAYTSAPFHLANVYVRGDSLSEFWAFVWFPTILLALGVTHGRRAVWLPALPLAALVVTHNVSAMLFAPFIVTWLLPELIALRVQPGALLRRLGTLLGAAALALALSAWFWAPALIESAQAQLGEQTSGYFHYSRHFRTLDLCPPAVFTNSCPERPIDQIPLVQTTLFVDPTPPHAFGMGLLQTITVAAGAWAWLRRRELPRRAPALFALATIGVVGASTPIWEAIRPLQLAQFPWRLLSVQALFGSLLVGALVARRSRASTTAAFAVAVALLASIAPLTTRVDSLRITRDDLGIRNFQLFEWYSGIIGTTIRGEYLPATVQPSPAIGPDLLGRPRRALIAEDGAPATALDSALAALDSDSQTWILRVDADELTMALPLLYTNAWEAVDVNTGAAVPLQAYVGSGWTQLTLPRGEHTVMLRYVGTPLQRAGLIVSLVALVALAATAGRPSRSSLRRVAAAALAFAMLVALPYFADRLIRRRAPMPPHGPFVDFTSKPFVHAGGMALVNGERTAELLDAAVEPPTVRAGDSFTLTLRWRDAEAPLELVQELPSASPRFDLFRHARERSQVNTTVSRHATPRDALPGPLLIMLVPAEGWSTSTHEAYVAGKTGPGVTLVGPTVTDTAPNAPSNGVAAFENGIRAHVVDWLRPDGERICFRAQWSRSGAVNRADALNVSFKLFAADGRLVAQADGQPQQGLAPTWSWLDDVVVHDSRCVSVVDPRRPLLQDEPYRLTVTWYRLRDMQVTGHAELGGRADAADGAVNVAEALP